MKLKRPLIVASIPFRSIKQLEKIKHIDVDLIELRLDYMEDPFSLNPISFYEYKDKIILTLRDPKEGGKYSFDEIKKANLLMRFHELGIKYDVEVNFQEKYNIPYDDKIVSSHFLERLPSKKEIEDIISKYSRKAFAVKIALKAIKNYKELLAFALSFNNVAVMAIGGDPLERIAFSLLGSKLIYCYVEEATAEGQLYYKKIQAIFNEIFSK